MSTTPLYINSARVESASFPLKCEDGAHVVSYVNGRRKVYFTVSGRMYPARRVLTVIALRNVARMEAARK